jgi:hypothetical protein
MPQSHPQWTTADPPQLGVLLHPKRKSEIHMWILRAQLPRNPWPLPTLWQNDPWLMRNWNTLMHSIGNAPKHFAGHMTNAWKPTILMHSVLRESVPLPWSRQSSTCLQTATWGPPNHQQAASNSVRPRPPGLHCEQVFTILRALKRVMDWDKEEEIRHWRTCDSHLTCVLCTLYLWRGILGGWLFGYQPPRDRKCKMSNIR